MTANFKVDELNSSTGKIQLGGNVLDLSNSNSGFIIPSGPTSSEGTPSTNALRIDTNENKLKVFNNDNVWMEVMDRTNPLSNTRNSIIRDGLVLLLDAGNSASYPGSGNIWYDLSPTGAEGDIRPNVIYQDGYFRFTVNQNADNRIDIPHNDAFNYDYRSWAYSLWVRTNFDDNASWAQFFIKGNDGGNRRPGIWYYSGQTSRFHITWNAAGQGQQTLNTSDPITLPLGEWVNWVFQSRDGIMMTFKNAVQDSQTLQISDRNFNDQPIHIGNWNYRAPGMDVAFFSLYNRSLSDDEITQNFNALRSRFNV